MNLASASTGCTLATGNLLGMVTRRSVLNYLYWTAYLRPDRDALFHRSSGRINQTRLARELGCEGSTITHLIQADHEVGKAFLLHVLAWSQEPNLETLLPKIRSSPPAPDNAYRQKIAD